MRVEKLKADDLKKLLERRAKSFLGVGLTEAQVISLEASEHTYTAFFDGKPIICGGVTEYWRNRGEAWAVVDPECRQHFVSIHSAVKRFLDICPVTRVEAAVEIGFEAGHRWVRALGFKYEATCRKFLPDGQTALLYSRVRE